MRHFSSNHDFKTDYRTDYRTIAHRLFNRSGETPLPANAPLRSRLCLVCLGVLGAAGAAAGLLNGQTSPGVPVSQQARKLHESSLVFDGHVHAMDREFYHGGNM